MSLIDRGMNIFRRVQSTAQNTVDRAQRTVGNAVDAVQQGAQRAGQFVDSFEQQAVSKAQAVRGLFGGDAPDRVHDGKFVGAGGQTFPPGTPLSQIPGVTPRDNPNPSQTILYVNGINNTKDGQARSLQQIADTTGARVVGVHNATEGTVADLAQAVKDKLDKGTNPAVDTLADTLYSELKAGRSIHVMGHSQGGLILSRALNDVSRRLRLEDGLAQADAEKLLSRVNVETFGAAACRYPDGPQYVHYVNNKDLVPTLFGLGDGDSPLDFARHAGRDAVVRHFEHGSGLSGTHHLSTAYLPYRVPFDEARAGQR
jgi:hypothetical protein